MFILTQILLDFITAIQLLVIMHIMQIFLNQACAWFLRIASVCECLYACVCVFACVSVPRLLITSGMMWCDIDPI